MTPKSAKRTAIIIFSVFLGTILLTFLVSFFIRGYRLSIKRKQIVFSPTGLLLANSEPKGASVYIDEELATATDDTLNLSPNEYQIKLEKDGFAPWQKKLTIKKEIVSQTSAVLFRNAPDLKPLTTTNAFNPTLSHDGRKIVFVVSGSSLAGKNGVWVLDLSSSLSLTLSNLKQLTGPIESVDWANTKFVWSPDDKTVLLIQKKQGEVANVFSISTDQLSSSKQLNDTAYFLQTTISEWIKDLDKELKNKLEKLPSLLRETIISSTEAITFNLDEEKFFYTATASARLADNLLPHPPARSTQPETRKIEPGNVYAYDLKEDTNFLIGSTKELGLNYQPENKSQPAPSKSKQVTPTPNPLTTNYLSEPTTLHWLTPNHLVYIDKEKNEVKVVEYDGTNRQTIYSGPFENSFVFPSPSQKSLIILTSLHPNSPGNLYEVKVR